MKQAVKKEGIKIQLPTLGFYKSERYHFFPARNFCFVVSSKDYSYFAPQY